MTGYSSPFIVFDGTDAVWEQNPPNYDSVYQQHYEIARVKQPFFNLYIDSAFTQPSQGSFKLKIVTADTIPEGEITAFIAITEDSLQGAFTTFYRVCRALYEFPVVLTYPDSTEQRFDFNHNIPVSKLRATVFIQDKDTKEVLQTITTRFEEEQ